MGFRSGSGRHCKHLRSAWHVLITVDKFDGIMTVPSNARPIDFGVPWLPLPDDDIFHAQFPNIPLGQRPFGSDSYYPQYDRSEARGSKAEWARVSAELLSKFGVNPEDYTTYANQQGHPESNSNSKARASASNNRYQKAPSTPPRRDPMLETLGLTETPATLAEFKAAARKRIMDTHPDRGGSAEAFRTVYMAYETLAFRLFRAKV